MNKKKSEELKELRERLIKYGLTIDRDMRGYRMKRLENEHQKIIESTEVVFSDIKESIEMQSDAKFIYYKLDKDFLYDKFYDNEYEMIYLPLEDISVCKLTNKNAKKIAKERKLYHESKFEKYLLIYESELRQILEKNNLSIEEHHHIISNDVQENISVIKPKEKVRKL